MTEEKPAASAPVDDDVDYAGRPFGYLEPGSKTAMVCEQDASIREKISAQFKTNNFVVMEPPTFKEALQHMRYNTFDVIVLDEDFDAGTGGGNNFLNHITGLPMNIRRKTCVALLSSTLDTMDNMRAYNKSVNFIINKSGVDNAASILKRGIADNDEFYHEFKEAIRKSGKA